MTGGFEEPQDRPAEADLIAFARGNVGEFGAGALAQMDLRAGARGQLAMAADEIGVQVGLNDVLDLQAVLAGFIEIELDVALGIDHAGDTSPSRSACGGMQRHVR